MRPQPQFQGVDFFGSIEKEEKGFVPSPRISLDPTVVERSSLIPYSNSPLTGNEDGAPEARNPGQIDLSQVYIF
jgi:hypothetical protein